jgi:hypothetical protein
MTNWNKIPVIYDSQLGSFILNRDAQEIIKY